jgi:hypothetical protein
MRFRKPPMPAISALCMATHSMPAGRTRTSIKDEVFQGTADGQPLTVE